MFCAEMHIPSLCVLKQMMDQTFHYTAVIYAWAKIDRRNVDTMCQIQFLAISDRQSKGRLHGKLNGSCAGGQKEGRLLNDLRDPE